MAEDVIKQLLSFRSELFGFVRALVRNGHEAEDVYQEISVVIVEKAKQGEEIRNFRAWAKEIARRKVKQHFRERKAGHTAPLPHDDMIAVVEDAFTSSEPGSRHLVDEREAVRNCIEKTPQHAWNLLSRRMIEGHSYATIARAVEKTEAAVRRAVARIRLAFVDCVRGRLQQQEQEI